MIRYLFPFPLIYCSSFFNTIFRPIFVNKPLHSAGNRVTIIHYQLLGHYSCPKQNVCIVLQNASPLKVFVCQLFCLLDQNSVGCQEGDKVQRTQISTVSSGIFILNFLNSSLDHRFSVCLLITKVLNDVWRPNVEQPSLNST